MVYDEKKWCAMLICSSGYISVWFWSSYHTWLIFDAIFVMQTPASCHVV